MRHIINRGEYWKLHDNGNIERPGLFGPSGHWSVVGAVERNNFGHVVKRYTLSEILAEPNAIPWKFKNGKQRTFIRDFDHGTLREWGGPHRVTS